MFHILYPVNAVWHTSPSCVSALLVSIHLMVGANTNILVLFDCILLQILYNLVDIAIGYLSFSYYLWARVEIPQCMPQNALFYCFNDFKDNEKHSKFLPLHWNSKVIKKKKIITTCICSRLLAIELLILIIPLMLCVKCKDRWD